MANTLGVYNPIFYAQEALIQLEKALGMAGRVHRGFDAERRSFGKGQVISIRKPSTFSVEDAPSTAQDVTTETTNITLDQWKEVKFKLTDQELAYTGERIISDHIRPAAYALANHIDVQLASLYKYVPWYVDLNSTIAVSDATNVYQKLFDNAVPVGDPSALHYMLNGITQNGFQQLTAFNSAANAGAAGLETLQRGSLGIKFGMEMFGNQNVQSHTAGAMADGAGTVTGVHAIGATSITIGALTDTQTVKQGDSFVIAGNTQRYVFTEDGTVASSSLTSIGIYPALVAATAGSEVVTVRVDSHTANLAFHRNAFALAMAPLSEMGNELGAKIATITDPVSGLSIRSRLYYVGNSSEVHVALDVLFGYKCLDGNLATRACG